MAGMDLLEREIERQTEGRQTAAKNEMSEAELAHRRMMSENMHNLLYPQEDSRFDRYSPASDPNVRTYDYDNMPLTSDRVPAYQNPIYSTSEYHAPAVPNAPDAPSAAKRIADYVPVMPGMQSVQRFGDMPARRVENYAPVAEPEAAPRSANLFENVLYRDGEAVVTGEVAPAPVYAPARTAAPRPQEMPYENYEEDESDALPTRRTLETIRRSEERETSANTNFFSALSMKTKLVLAAVAAVIAILITAICVNTAILNSLNRDIAAKQSAIGELKGQIEVVEGQIEDLTSRDHVFEWAEQQPDLTPPEGYQK